MVPYLCVLVSCHSHGDMDTIYHERVWKDRSREGRETTQQNRNHFSVDTPRSGVLSCRLPPQSKTRAACERARHTRGRRRPLGPEGLATLALRQLNRQPAGVLALNYTTFRLHHHHGVRTSAKPVCKQRQAEVSHCLQKRTATGASPCPPRPARQLWPATLAGLPHAAYARGRQKTHPTCLIFPSQ